MSSQAGWIVEKSMIMQRGNRHIGAGFLFLDLDKTRAHRPRGKASALWRALQRAAATLDISFILFYKTRTKPNEQEAHENTKFKKYELTL